MFAASKSLEKHPSNFLFPQSQISRTSMKEITGMRNKLIHAYFGMDTETIWKTIKHNITALKQTIQKIKKDQE